MKKRQLLQWIHAAGGNPDQIVKSSSGQFAGYWRFRKYWHVRGDESALTWQREMEKVLSQVDRLSVVRRIACGERWNPYPQESFFEVVFHLENGNASDKEE